MTDFKAIVKSLTECPDSQISNKWRDKCAELMENDGTQQEAYDLLAEISKLPCVKVADFFSVGEISSFVQKLCEVEKYYPRPE